MKFRDLEVPREAIELGKELGHGNFGTVNLGMYYSKLKVAVKLLKPGTMPVEEFLEEAKMMHRLSHRYIVQILGVVTRTEPTLLITGFLTLLLMFLHFYFFIRLHSHHSI